MVDEDGDTAVGIEAEEPVFLLLVGHDVAGEEKRVSYLDNIGILADGYEGGAGRT